MNTLNKKQLYKLIKSRGACRNGLKRLRYHMKTKTAREIIDLYRNRFLERYLNEEPILASDYRWFCNNIGISYMYAPDAKTIINKIAYWL